MRRPKVAPTPDFAAAARGLADALAGAGHPVVLDDGRLEAWALRAGVEVWCTEVVRVLDELCLAAPVRTPPVDSCPDPEIATEAKHLEQLMWTVREAARWLRNEARR